MTKLKSIFMFILTSGTSIINNYASIIITIINITKTSTNTITTNNINTHCN